MILSKSNIMRNNTTTLDVGTLSSGALSNIRNPNFALVASSNSAIFTFTIEAIGSIRYVALHGISLPIGAVVTLTGTGFSETYTIVRDIKNLVFYVEAAVTVGDLEVEINGAGSKTISYMQAGGVTEIDWGTNAGQPLHYLGNNLKNRVTSTSRGMPVARIQEETTPRLRLTAKNALKSWARTDLRTLFNHYNEGGIVSMLDYEEEGKPEESAALFDLSSADVKTHSATTTLVDVSFTFKAMA